MSHESVGPLASLSLSRGHKNRMKKKKCAMFVHVLAYTWVHPGVKYILRRGGNSLIGRDLGVPAA